MDRYRKMRIIGAGSFGTAWLVESNFSGKKYALKELCVSTMSEQDRHLSLNEAKILSRLKHKNVVRYREAFVQENKLYIAMEYAEQGDLYTRIKQQNGQYFIEQQILEWFTQICLALKYIHAQHILHRDLKTQNIFLTKEDVIKLGDFGIARVLNSTTDHAQTAVGTPYYLSPEICQQKPYNHKSDMWSLGCVLYELTTLQHAFNADNLSGLVIKILQGKYPSPPSCYGPLLEDLISVLLKRNPDERPSAKQLLHVPAMRPYVERFVNFEHSRMDSGSSEVSIAAENSHRREDVEGSAKREHRKAPCTSYEATKRKDESKRTLTERKGSTPDRTALRKCLDRKRGLGLVSAVKAKQTLTTSVSSRKSSARETDARWSEPRSQRCRGFLTGKELMPPHSPQIHSPITVDCGDKVFAVEHPAVSRLRERSDQQRKLSPRCQNNAKVSVGSHDRSAYVADAKLKHKDFIKRQRTQSDDAQRRKLVGKRYPRSTESQGKVAVKCNATSQEKKNQRHMISVSSKDQRDSRCTSISALKPINRVKEQDRQANRSMNETGIQKGTYTILCDKCPCLFYKPAEEEGKKREEKNTSTNVTSKATENRVLTHGDYGECSKEDEHFLQVNAKNCPPVKFTLCGETLQLNNITTADSSFAQIEALRLFLELRLGTSLLTDAYRYLTNASSKEEGVVYKTVGEILGTDRMAYVPVILQLIACETLFY